MRENRPSINYREVHFSSVVVDAHCDTLTAMTRQGRNLSTCSARGHLDLYRLLQGGVRAQFMAAFIAPEYKRAATSRALELIDLYFREVKQNNEKINHVENKVELQQALDAGKIASILAVEGGEAVEGSLGVLRIFYRLGVRCLTLTWNGRNELGDGVGEPWSRGGLTGFGSAVVREMNRLGMLVDVSHLSEPGFWDVLAVTRQPVIASHSNCRALCNHKRNLSDGQISALARNGGVMGVTFVPEFLAEKDASLTHILDHLDHAVRIGGVEVAGIGSDFDGTEALPGGIKDCGSFPEITRGLVERGYCAEDIKKILGGNFLRVLGQVLK